MPVRRVDECETLDELFTRRLTADVRQNRDWRLEALRYALAT